MIAKEFTLIDSLLIRLGPGFWLIGGALRDQHNGTVPKDLDIVYFGMTRHEATKRFRDAAFALGWGYQTVDHNLDPEHEASENSARPEFLGVDTRVLDTRFGTTLTVDLLWYDCPDVMTVFEKLDFNCNTVAKSWNGRHWAYRYGDEWGEWDMLGHLIQIRDAYVRPERVQYLIDKLLPKRVTLCEEAAHEPST